MASQEAQELHKNSIVIDGCCPLLVDPSYIDWYKEGGVTVATPSVGGPFSAELALRVIGAWSEYVQHRDDIELITKSAQVKRLKTEGKIGIALHFQGSVPIGRDLNMINAFKDLGVGMMQLCYNVDDEVGSGAQVEDQGLKAFGEQFIQRCNDVGVIVDCSHTGIRTTMEAIESTNEVVIFSHANPMAMYATESDRNVRDEQIKAIAATGGIIGLTGFPGFLVKEGQATMDQFLSHMDHLVKVAGIDHVALGIDYYLGQHPVADEAEAERAYRREIDSGRWRGTDYPAPPHYYPEGMETPKTLVNLTAAMLDRGYVDSDIQKILGLNWLNVYETVWG